MVAVVSLANNASVSSRTTLQDINFLGGSGSSDSNGKYSIRRKDTSIRPLTTGPLTTGPLTTRPLYINSDNSSPTTRPLYINSDNSSPGEIIP